MDERAYREATQRAHEAGARAIGYLQAALRLNEIDASSRVRVIAIIDAWNAAHEAATRALDAPEKAA